MSFAGGKVFDADVHIHESYADLLSYFERESQESLDHVRSAGSDNERFLDTPGYYPYTTFDPIRIPMPREEPHRVTSPDVLRADLTARGIDAGLIFTGRLLFAALGNDIRYAVRLARAFNRYLAERWVNPRQGLYAAIMAPGQAPEEAAEEIARYAKVDGFAAVYLPSAGNYPLWGDPQYDPIYRAAEEAELPVVLQGALTVHTVFPYQLHHVPTAVAKHVLSQSFGAQANLVSLITRGTLARFPRLKVVFNDAGLGWLPVVLGRLDHYYRYLREEMPFIRERPSDYVRQQVYLTTHPWDLLSSVAQVEACLEAVGVEHLLFGSDWPHFDSTKPEDIWQLPIGEAEKHKILRENASRVFRLG